MSTLTATPTTGRTLSIEARPGTLTIHSQQTAVLVVDMQNDFGAEGGMFHRAGIDISPIRAAIKPTAQVLDSARNEGIRIVYLKMGFRPDLSDAGLPGSPNRGSPPHAGRRRAGAGSRWIRRQGANPRPMGH